MRRGTGLLPLLAASLVACCGAKGGTPPLQFAFLGGALYARLTTEWEDRGDHTLYTLLQLARRGGLPDVRAWLGGVAGDGSGAAEGATLSFWRPTQAEGDNGNASSLLLWPDYDFSGWAAAWIAPHDAFAAALDADAPPWAKRRDSACPLPRTALAPANARADARAIHPLQACTGLALW